VTFEILKEVGGRNTNRWGRTYASVPLMPSGGQLDWEPAKVRLTKLANADMNTRLKFRFLNEENVEVAHFIATSNELRNKRDWSMKKGSGSVDIMFEVNEVPGFIEYLQAGWQISFCVAIDFTASNGDPKNSRSLHYLGQNNQYLSAIEQVGTIIEPYDYDKNFPTFGFGGIPYGTSQVSHCFPLNSNPGNPEIQGIYNIMQMYRTQLPAIKLYGPTFFGPLLEQFNAYAK